MNPRFLFVCACLLVTGRAAEERSPLTHLGEGAVYLRVRTAQDLQAFTALAKEDLSIVLDLRYPTTVELDSAVLTGAWADRRSERPVMLLVSPTTPATLTPALAHLPRHAVTLGAKDSLPAPQVVVEQSAEADRRAYEALDTGTPVDQLISGKIEKERYDEATLVQEFKNGNHDAEPPALPDPTGPKPLPKTESLAPTAIPPARPTDRVLQRAVHLHQALLALKSRG